MATGAVAKARPAASQESLFAWEGTDKAGKTVRGEMRAGGESAVAAALRRRGISDLGCRNARRHQAPDSLAGLPSSWG